MPLDQIVVETLVDVDGVAWRATNDSTSGFTRWGASSFIAINKLLKSKSYYHQTYSIVHIKFWSIMSNYIYSMDREKKICFHNWLMNDFALMEHQKPVLWNQNDSMCIGSSVKSLTAPTYQNFGFISILFMFPRRFRTFKNYFFLIIYKIYIIILTILQVLQELHFETKNKSI